MKIKSGKKFIKLRETKQIQDTEVYNSILKQFISKMKNWKVE
jgi:hypothetical protein